MEKHLGPAQLGVWRDFLRAHALVTAAVEADLEAGAGLALAEYEVLVSLAEAPGRRLRMQELAAGLGLSRSGLTRLVDRLVAEALVRRERCPDDGRGTYAVLTAAGRTRLRQASGGHSRAVRDHFVAALNAEQLRAFRGALAQFLR